MLSYALPGGVVVAIAAVGALHSAVAGKEVAAHAERVAVRRVLADELTRLHCRHGYDQGWATGCRRVRAEVVRSGLVTVVEAACYLGPVGNAWKFPEKIT